MLNTRKLSFQCIYDQINKADIIVADMTGKNPNVFYETGYAHALNKSVILLVKNADDIPFDLKHYHHIIYGGKITALKAELETWIRWYIDKPKDSPRKESRLPLIELSPFVIDKQVNRSVPPEWCARSLYLGLTGAQNWLSIANNSNHFYRAGYFKEIVTGLLAEDFLSDIEINAMVSLGPGNGDTDKILCTHLSEKRKIDYVPVDINPFLLTTAISRVGTSACTQFGVVCDFEDELVPFLRDALHANTQGPYLYAMLGYTVGNLDCREGKFFADIKALMNSGDYLLLDYIAIDEEWDYEEYSKTWRSEWDTVMCKFERELMKIAKFYFRSLIRASASNAAKVILRVHMLHI